MKMLQATLALVCFLCVTLAGGAEVSPPLLIITVSSSSSTVSTFVGSGATRFVQCSNTTGNIRYVTCATSSCTATADSPALPSSLGWDVMFRGSDHYIAFYGDGTGATCRVYDIDPQPRQF